MKKGEWNIFLCMEKESEFIMCVVTVAEADRDPPTTLLWTYHYLAQHHDLLGNTDTAMEFINMAVEHTVTMIEAYIAKARIYKVSCLLVPCFCLDMCVCVCMWTVHVMLYNRSYWNVLNQCPCGCFKSDAQNNARCWSKRTGSYLYDCWNKLRMQWLPWVVNESVMWLCVCSMQAT